MEIFQLEILRSEFLLEDLPAGTYIVRITAGEESVQS